MTEHESLVKGRPLEPRWGGEPLEMFLARTQMESDDAVVVFGWLPYFAHSDGTFGPPIVTLGRLREEFALRVAFPHEARTDVW